jgi:transcription initiation factor TFIIB
MRCPACGGPLVDDKERGEVVCAQCGLVVAESTVDTGPEWRVYKPEDVKRVRAAPLKLVVKTDMAVKPEHGERWLRLARLYKEALHSREVKLASIKAELRRIKECAGLPHHVAEAAEELAKRHMAVLKSLEPEVAAVAVLWTAAKALGEPRPLRDFLKCAKVDERRVKKAGWMLCRAVKTKSAPVEYYVKTVAARVDLPMSVVKAALELLKRRERLLVGKNPWVWAAAALWLASFRKPGLLEALAEAAGSSVVSIRDAASKLLKLTGEAAVRRRP